MPHQPKHPMIAVLALALIEFACGLDWMALNAIGGSLMRDLALSPASYALLVSAGSVTAGISGFLMAGFIDRFERRLVTEIMVGGLMLCALLTTQINQYWMLLVVRALAGMLGATAASQSYAMVADLFEPQRQPRAYAFVIGGYSACLGLGLPALVFVEAHLGWHSIYYLIALMLLVTLILIRWQIPVLQAHPGPAPWKQLVRMLQHRPHQLGLLLMSVVMGCGWMLVPFIAPYFTYTLRMTPSDIARFYLLAGIAVVSTNFAMSLLVEKWNLQRVLFGLIALTIPLQWLLTHLNNADVVRATLIAVCFYACSVSRWSLCNQLTTAHIIPGMRGGMMSLSFALQECVGGLVVTLGGTLMTMQDGKLLGYERLGMISIGFNLVLVYLVVLLSKQQVKPNQ